LPLYWRHQRLSDEEDLALGVERKKISIAGPDAEFRREDKIGAQAMKKNFDNRPR
jgi:hypothetical protein